MPLKCEALQEFIDWENAAEVILSRPGDEPERLAREELRAAVPTTPPECLQPPPKRRKHAFNAKAKRVAKPKAAGPPPIIMKASLKASPPAKAAPAKAAPRESSSRLPLAAPPLHPPPPREPPPPPPAQRGSGPSRRQFKANAAASSAFAPDTDWNHPAAVAAEQHYAFTYGNPFKNRGPPAPGDGGPDTWRGQAYRPSSDRWGNRGGACRVFWTALNTGEHGTRDQAIAAAARCLLVGGSGGGKSSPAACSR